MARRRPVIERRPLNTKQAASVLRTPALQVALQRAHQLVAEGASFEALVEVLRREYGDLFSRLWLTIEPGGLVFLRGRARA